jgi:hypothetical protein
VVVEVDYKLHLRLKAAAQVDQVVAEMVQI